MKQQEKNMDTDCSGGGVVTYSLSNFTFGTTQGCFAACTVFATAI